MMFIEHAKKTFPFMKREIKRPFLEPNILFSVLEETMEGNLIYA